MELKTNPRNKKKNANPKDSYHYAYKIKGGNIVRFKGDPAINKEFDIHQYGESGTLYYRK